MNVKFFFRKIHKFFFERIVGKLFYQYQDEALKKQTPFKRFLRFINQRSNEAGFQLPWYYTKEECVEFWQSISNQSLSIGNRPEGYARKDHRIIDVLHFDFWFPICGPENSVLELGCNCGANLFWLNKLNYKDVSGIEVNPNAIEQMDKTFPEFRSIAKIKVGSFENLLPQLPADSFDMVFTMGVSMHIHPHNNYLFDEMVRISKKFICTIEPEYANSNYVFARNYRRFFKKMGCSQIRSVLLTEEAFPGIKDYSGCTMRLFKKCTN